MMQTGTGAVSSGQEIKIHHYEDSEDNRLSREVVQSPSMEVSRSNRTKGRANLSDLRADPAVS